MFPLAEPTRPDTDFHSRLPARRNLPSQRAPRYFSLNRPFKACEPPNHTGPTSIADAETPDFPELRVLMMGAR
jgi:hypothetical protein